MDKLLKASTLEQLEVLNSVVHDCFFARDEVVFNEDSQELSIPFEYPVEEQERSLRRLLLARKVETPFAKANLLIRRVTSCAIDDTEKVGTYDINRIDFDSTSGVVTVRTGVPIGIRVSVEQLDIAVSLTETVVGWQQGWRFLGWRFRLRPRS